MSSKGKSSRLQPADLGVRENSRGSQSSSSQGGSSLQLSGSSSGASGPPKSPPSSTITSGALEQPSYAQVMAKGATGPPKDQGKRSVDQRDRSKDSQVQYSTVFLM